MMVREKCILYVMKLLFFECIYVVLLCVMCITYVSLGNTHLLHVAVFTARSWSHTTIASATCVSLMSCMCMNLQIYSCRSS